MPGGSEKHRSASIALLAVPRATRTNTDQTHLAVNRLRRLSARTTTLHCAIGADVVCTATATLEDRHTPNATTRAHSPGNAARTRGTDVHKRSARTMSVALTKRMAPYTLVHELCMPPTQRGPIAHMLALAARPPRHAGDNLARTVAKTSAKRPAAPTQYAATNANLQNSPWAKMSRARGANALYAVMLGVLWLLLPTCKPTRRISCPLATTVPGGLGRRATPRAKDPPWRPAGRKQSPQKWSTPLVALL